MPVRRGHVAPQNTFLGVIIRKFEGQSEYHRPLVPCAVWVRCVLLLFLLCKSCCILRRFVQSLNRPSFITSRAVMQTSSSALILLFSPLDNPDIDDADYNLISCFVIVVL